MTNPQKIVHKIAKHSARIFGFAGFSLNLINLVQLLEKRAFKASIHPILPSMDAMSPSKQLEDTIYLVAESALKLGRLKKNIAI